MEKYLEQTIQAYSNSAKAYEAKVAKLHHRPEGEFFTREIPTNGRILDVGCADGRDCKIFYEKGFQVTGIDLTDKFLEIASRKVPKGDFINMDMRKLNFNNDYFHGIWSCASIVHLNSRGVYEFLTEARRVLKEKGIIYIAAKEATQLNSSSKKSFFFYNKQEIKEMLERAKLQTIYISGNNKIEVGGKIHSEVRAFARK